MSKLTSVDKEPVRSLGRLGGDSPLTAERSRNNPQEHQRQREADVYLRGTACGVNSESHQSTSVTGIRQDGVINEPKAVPEVICLSQI